jgi:hypothetical protein
VSIQETTDRQERLGGDAPLRISARGHGDDADPARTPGGVPAFARSAELVVFAAGVIAVLVAAAADAGFGAERAWTLVTVLAAAFILRRR